MSDPQGDPQQVRQRAAVNRQRWRLLRYVNDIAETPLVILSLVWLVLFVIQTAHGLSGPWLVVQSIIWGLFILDFLLELLIAPSKRRYLRRNWLVAVSLALPALRVFRAVAVVRWLRLVRLSPHAWSMTLLRLVTSINRGMGMTARVLGRQGLGYVIAVTIVVLFAGAAGMLAFENPRALRQAGHGDLADGGGGLHNYGESLWWTAMVLTTMGSDYFPKTTPGRIVCWGLALYGFAIFGYIAAAMAGFLVGRQSDADRQAAHRLRRQDLAGLREEIAALRRQVERMGRRQGRGAGDEGRESE